MFNRSFFEWDGMAGACPFLSCRCPIFLNIVLWNGVTKKDMIGRSNVCVWDTVAGACLNSTFSNKSFIDGWYSFAGSQSCLGSSFPMSHDLSCVLFIFDLNGVRICCEVPLRLCVNGTSQPVWSKLSYQPLTKLRWWSRAEPQTFHRGALPLPE